MKVTVISDLTLKKLFKNTSYLYMSKTYLCLKLDYAPSTACGLSSSMNDNYTVEIMHLQVHLHLLACCCHNMTATMLQSKNSENMHSCANFKRYS